MKTLRDTGANMPSIIERTIDDTLPLSVPIPGVPTRQCPICSRTTIRQFKYGICCNCKRDYVLCTTCNQWESKYHTRTSIKTDKKLCRQCYEREWAGMPLIRFGNGKVPTAPVRKILLSMEHKKDNTREVPIKTKKPRGTVYTRQLQDFRIITVRPVGAIPTGTASDSGVGFRRTGGENI